MPVFEYAALDGAGRRQHGTIDAPSKELAINKLREEHFMPLAIEPMKQPINIEDIIARYRPIGLEPLVYFSRQLATMIDSGMAPLRALTTLEEAETNPKFKEVLSDLITRIESGLPLHQAFAEHPDVFSRLYIAMVRSGEESGNLHGALQELATQLEKQLRLKRAIRSATMYPRVVAGFAFFIISGLMLEIIPRFAKIFQQAVQSTNVPTPGHPTPSAALPALTQFMVDVSHLFYPNTAHNIFWYLQVGARFVGFFAFIFGMRWLVKRILKEEGPRRRWDRFKLNAPMRIGPLVQKITVARFSRTFASLLSSGVPAVESMAIVADTAGNFLVEEAVMRAREQMMAGANISQPLSRSGAFPTIVTRMIEVGEETGQLQLMLEKVAGFFEEEVEMAIKGLTSIIEPLMIMIVGSIIGIIIIAIYLPMFSLYDKINTAPGAAVISLPLMYQYLRYLRHQRQRIRDGWQQYLQATETPEPDLPAMTD
jgi:type IV pilus assembly protein PilC